MDVPYLTATVLAQHIRKTLKGAFPKTIFRVRSKYYSMGSSVYVSWTDGPTDRMVDRLLSQFRGISFNGSDDSTHYNTITIDGQIFKAGSYVSTSRELSDEARAAATRVAELRGEDFWPTAAQMRFTSTGFVFVTEVR